MLTSNGTKTFGDAEIAVVLRHLVLEDQVVAKRVPRELGGEPVVLVEVVAGMRQDEVWVDPLQLLEDILDATPVVRKIAIAKLVEPHIRRARRREEIGRTGPRLVGSLPVGREHDPCHVRDRGAHASARGCVPPHPISMSSA